MPSPGGQFFSDEYGDIEDYFISDYQLIDQYIGDTLWVWGVGTRGKLGNNATTNRSTPVTTVLGGTNWKSASFGDSAGGAIKTDGTLWLWARNSSGTLGNNATADRSIPITTILGGTNWKSVDFGSENVAAIKTDGTLWVWGINSNGQLGINATANRSIPVTTILGGTNWKSVTAGDTNTTSIKTDGTLWIWGSNGQGQLGVFDAVARSIPVTTILGGTNWKSVKFGNTFVAALKGDGTLWTWGNNGNGQLGINNTTDRSIPITTILGGTNWKQVSCGGNHAAAIKTDGTLWTWGNNPNGQLGINDTLNRSIPVTTILGGNNWKSIDCAGQSSSAIKTDGTLWVWGSNGQGQLGINTSTDRSIPVTTILGGTNWKSSAVGGSYMGALTAGLNVDFS